MINFLLTRSLFVFLFVFAFSGFIQAQFNETIRTGRPGQSINPFTTGKGVLQFQQGFKYNNNTTQIPMNPGSANTKEYVLNTFITENVIRYGIMEKVEVNAEINYEWLDQEAQEPLQVFDFEGGYLSTLDIGGRVHLADQAGFWPNVALQARLGMGQYYKGGDFEVMDVKITGAFSWSFNENHGLTINLIPIVNVDGYSSSNDYTVAYSWSFTEKWGVFIENYGTLYIDPIVNNTFDMYFDGGFSYLVNNNVQLDILGGYGKNSIFDGATQESYFVSAGVSWRILTAK